MLKPYIAAGPDRAVVVYKYDSRTTMGHTIGYAVATKSSSAWTWSPEQLVALGEFDGAIDPSVAYNEVQDTFLLVCLVGGPTTEFLTRTARRDGRRRRARPLRRRAERRGGIRV
ncbi:MAG: hypothetical protein U1D55_10495 [Phycisphaerae bacterium]